MQQLQEFWALVLDVWNQGFLGIEISRLLGALGIFLLFLIFRRLFTTIVLARLKRLAKRTDGQFDDELIGALEQPVRFIPVVMGAFFASEYLGPEGTFQLITDNVLRSLVVLTIFWGFFNAIGPLSFLFSRLERVFTRPMIDWLVKAIKIGIVFIGAATVLEIWGIEVGPIIAGLGLFGVAVALGAQDLFKNLIAGILVLAEKRFHPGDWIRVDGVVEGTVETIGFRSTRVRRFDKAPVFVPNAKLSDNAVTNFSAMTHRRIYWKIGVEYRTTVDQLREIRNGIENYVVGNEDFAPPSEASTFVRIDSFNDSSIDIMLYCFTKTTNWGEWLEIKEQLAYHIMKVVEEAGSGFAFPSQSLYVESLPDDRPEPFVPPKDSPSGHETSASSVAD
ncbi:mechanosensitive ion channel family protein [Pelagibius litoralis]|uniref:Mechanosensitive ion channel family protein n=1 Tax=Pelagibius litoralis TaxID=374515 RepID=A0A967C1H1_9PROT|nr:mechanosensitive ion channel family protein [Pelagibius litoralis]NIA67066.1 mechanosensitive ion channel family protein [Pelagibius litoralis]